MKKIRDFFAELLLISVIIVCIVCCIGMCYEYCKDFLHMDSNMIAAISTTIATVAAVVFGCFGDRIKDFFSEKPNIAFLRVEKIPQNVQNCRAYEIYRLVLKNDSRKTVEQIFVEAVEIKNAYGTSRKIVPAPFKWTHLDSVYRDVASGQCVYLDFIESSVDMVNRLSTRFVLPHLNQNPHMTYITGNCSVKIKCYGDNIEASEINLKIDYVSNGLGALPNINVEKV